MKPISEIKKEFYEKCTDGFDCVDSNADLVWQFIEEQILEVEKGAVTKWREDLGFYEFIDFIGQVLDAGYPADVFDGSSGDVGSTFIVEVRAAIRKLGTARVKKCWKSKRSNHD